MLLKTIHDMSVSTADTVLVRVDSDVDIVNGHIVDDTRLLSSLDSIKEIVKKGAKVIVIGHLGRPDGVRKKELSLEIIADWYAKKFEGKVDAATFQEFTGWQITPQLSLLENIRYYKNEEENDGYLARSLARLGTLFVNEAFAVTHRAHASTEGITHYLPSFAGLHLAQEVAELSQVMRSPERPLVVVIGGAKIETKLPMVEKMHHIADYVLVGGEIAEQDNVLLKVQHERVLAKRSVLLVADVTEDKLDITPKSAENFAQVLQQARTVVWNGPVGMTGHGAEHEKGTALIAQTIARLHAHTIVGGGDTLVYLKQEHLLDKFSFVSTGGGAMLEFLSGKMLPGIKPLLKK